MRPADDLRRTQSDTELARAPDTAPSSLHSRASPSNPRVSHSNHDVELHEENESSQDTESSHEPSPPLSLSQDNNSASITLPGPTEEEKDRGLPRACLFVASLNAQRTEDQLHNSVTQHFQSYGDLVDVKVFKDTQNRPYAFVQFKESADADRANVELQGSSLDGRKIRIEQAKVHRSLFFSFRDGHAISTPSLRPILTAFGPLEDYSLLPCPSTGTPHSVAFVKFRFREDAIKAYLEFKQNSQWLVEWTNHAMRESAKPIDKVSLFVGQLNQHQITQDMLETRFGQYGKMTECKLVNRQRDEKCKQRLYSRFVLLTFSV